MKISALLLLACCLHVSALTLGQTVTLSEHKAPLEKVIGEIKQQTGYSFFYNEDWIKQAQPVDLVVKNTTLENALQLCFTNQPFSYAIVNKTIVLKLKEKPVEKKENNPPPTELTGHVVTKQGQPLSGATVFIKRTKYGTLTDEYGNFKLKNVLANDSLIISFLGYRTITIAIDGKAEVRATLEEATNNLDQVVIQAYGKTSQRLTTSDIGRITAKDIEQDPVANPLLALQGKVAGLDVSQISGFASAPIKVELRGRAAINNSFTSDPLYIVDGVPLTVLDITGNANYGTGYPGFLQSGQNGPAGGQSPFFSINPADIASIEVLKDADATAIYGSRGANGVIIVTTKKGTAGKTTFDANVSEGLTSVTRYYDLMNTQQYLAMRKEAFKNDNINYNTTSLGNNYDLTQFDPNCNPS